MDYTSPSDLKTILHSKRANLYYLEHCRVLASLPHRQLRKVVPRPEYHGAGFTAA
ncbi:hypothetical protein [Methylococcus mesophilus]|uniref:hypothetical protein n=1 Tax=Methylococcus mesophilus TaxID=2993564 RepID=UPI00224A8B94|nr:hypothetical protein [Methylococcus mesophilus]UZR28183.1 hypothetical protein OOT43_15905 [Methylococcus mesophilus]